MKASGFLLALALLTAMPTTALADSNTVLQGHVYRDDGKPAAGARIEASAQSGTYRTKTDANGRFVLFGLETDTYEVTANAFGFAPGIVPGTIVTPGETEFVVISLWSTNCPSYGYSIRGGSSYLVEAHTYPRGHFFCM